jgi:hypothetical protein
MRWLCIPAMALVLAAPAPGTSPNLLAASVPSLQDTATETTASLPPAEGSPAVRDTEAAAPLQVPGDSAAAPTSGRVEYSAGALGFAALLVVLLGFLFFMLLGWSHRLDQASYLGNVYEESVEDFEYKRLAVTPTERWERNEYHREIASDPAWREKHPEPTRPEGVERWYRDPWSAGTRPPGLGEGMGGLGGDAPSEELRQKQQEYNRAMRQWEDMVRAEAHARYRNDLERARSRARERAALATSVDLAALRGRGAEFVLEFTTVVVIIFAAVVLGVLRVLGTEQIGTLLAAIAGYVLGRATTRTRDGGGQAPALGARMQPGEGAKA